MFQILLVIIYLAFISLGLPDSMLGSAWPDMYLEFGVPLSYAGIISAIISVGTILSSLLSDRLTAKLGAGKVTAISVGMTTVSMFGFALTHNYWLLCFWAIPYGLGGGSVDAALNNYVALHYESRHMSWLHCMWGLGAATGPYIMGNVLTAGYSWNTGYRLVGFLQLALTAALFLSLPRWKSGTGGAGGSSAGKRKPVPMREVLRIKGAGEILICFFCYCALEQTAGLWASTYLNLHKGIAADTAASFASLFFIGITVGRAVSGFMTMKFSDIQMIRLGESIILLGLVLMLLPLGNYAALAGLIIVGLGCAPVYPCIIHSTPARFGEANSQAVIGVQMAFAYTGILIMPPLFGVLANAVSVSLLPVYLLVTILVMLVSHELSLKYISQ